jgi:hypothetical protein
MPKVNSKCLKCLECTCLGYLCMNMSWVSLDKTYEEYRKKVDEDKRLLLEVVSRLM